jgi:adenylate cyclase
MTEERVERRLTAILAAGVAGYSRLMGADEEGTLAALKVLRREVADPKIKEHRGRIVNMTGDGLLSEFASVVDAVRCAVEMQREMAARNAGVPAERRIDFRIGVNLGDIMIDENDIFGDRVKPRGAPRSLGRTGWHLRQPGGAGSGARQARPFVRGHGRAAGQEHRPAGARLSRPSRREGLRAFNPV